MRTGRKLLLILAVLSAVSCVGGEERKLIGYYPYWMRGTLPVENIQFEHLTHVIHAFAWPDEDGNIAEPENFPFPELIDAAHAAGRKVLLGLGGYGQSDAFPGVVASPEKRAIFIENLEALLLAEEYDGVDLDWEFPRNATDRANLTLFVEELRAAFDAIDPDWLITMAVNPGNWVGQWFDFPALVEHINWFGEMAYDFHGGWTDHAGHNAPLYQPANDFDGSAQTGLSYLHKTRKIPKSKIVLGVPFYGREFNAGGLYQKSTGGDKAYRYSEILGLIENGWQMHWDDFSKVPWLLNPTGDKLVTYDDPMSVQLKSEFAIAEELAGVMIWSLGQDVLARGEQPLLQRIGETLQNATTVNEANAPLPDEFSLLQNHPNPFNPSTTIAFRLPKNEKITLKIFDAVGREVAVLAQKRLFARGEHSLEFDAKDLASGVYIYVLEADGLKHTKKMVLLR